VACPRCDQLAFIRLTANDVRLSCAACAYNQRRPSSGGCWPNGSAPVVLDSWFGAPLWLQMPSVGHVLWAVNGDHLAYIESYIMKGLRRDRRPFVLFGSALGEQLPKWMVTAKNREAVTKAVRHLDSMVPAPSPATE